MKEVKNYILLVDNYRRPSRRRNTAGRYRVGAKTPEEATELLREKIKFGSIQVYYECNPKNELPSRMVGYKEVVKEVSGYALGEGNIAKFVFEQVQPRSAIAPQKEE
jgi:hypothetical protein